MLGVVVSGPNGVTLTVSQLPFNRISTPALLVEQRRSHAPKAVTGHFIFSVAQPPKPSVDRVITHWAKPSPDARKYKPRPPRERLEVLKNSHGLTRQRNDMLFTHFHSLCRNSPLRVLQIEFSPLRLPQLARPRKHQGRETQRTASHECTLVVVDGAHQCTHRLGLSDRWKMDHGPRC